METFSAFLAICARNLPVTDQWHGTLTFSLICASTNGWVNNDEASDLRRYGAHYDVIVMLQKEQMNSTPFSLTLRHFRWHWGVQNTNDDIEINAICSVSVIF